MNFLNQHKLSNVSAFIAVLCNTMQCKQIKTMQKPFTIFLVVFSFNLSMLCRANEANHLRQMIKTRRRSQSTSFSGQDYWTELLLSEKREYSPVFIAPQEGLMQTDKIEKLPGQPDNVDFDQYLGYVTVDPKAGRALFYYFVESPSNSSTNPLLLWLNGGPGCSSFGAGAMQELGPFRVKSDGKALYRNDYAWNNVANVIFLESPAGVGFSYSNTSSDYNVTGDTSTTNDSYTFLVNWLERFPQYKTRDLYIAGESYAGHYAPQLAQTILINNKNTNQTVINLKGIAIGNALVNDALSLQGDFDHIWTHALNSDETHRDIIRYCDFESVNLDDQCYNALYRSELEMGSIDIDNIYAPNPNSGLGNSTGSINFIDPSAGDCVSYYLNTPEVQKALHVNPTTWILCRTYRYWTDWQRDVLPTIKFLMASNMRVWFYSADVDANVPVTSTRYVINSLKLPIESAWRPWYLDNEVGGYVVGYKGLTFVTVRGAGHWAPSDQPQRSLTMISSFLQGLLPPPSSA